MIGSLVLDHMRNSSLSEFSLRDFFEPRSILAGLLSSHTPAGRTALEDSGRHRKRLGVPVSLLAEQQQSNVRT